LRGEGGEICVLGKKKKVEGGEGEGDETGRKRGNVERGGGEKDLYKGESSILRGGGGKGEQERDTP